MSKACLEQLPCIVVNRENVRNLVHIQLFGVLAIAEISNVESG